MNKPKTLSNFTGNATKSLMSEADLFYLSMLLEDTIADGQDKDLKDGNTIELSKLQELKEVVDEQIEEQRIRIKILETNGYFEQK